MFSRPQLLRYAQLLLVCVAMITMLGAGNSDDSRFQRMGHEMVCACGCGQILLECNHVGCTYSSRMIDELHTQIGSGGSDKAILTWFAAKYGAVILAAPSAAASTMSPGSCPSPSCCWPPSAPPSWCAPGARAGLLSPP